MSLYLRPTKTGLRFEYTDDDAETVISIDKSEDEADTVRKLRRVIALVEGGGMKPITHPIADWTAPVQGSEVSGGDVVPSTNGWKDAYAPPAPPAHWAGQVELIQPGEDA